MKFRTTILLIAILAACVGYLVVRTKWMTKTAQGPSGATRSPALTPEDLRTISITPADGEPIELTRLGDRWRLTKPLDAPADPMKVEQLVTALKGLEYSRRLDGSDRDADPAITGLDKPQWIVSVEGTTGKSRGAGEPKVLLIGAAVPSLGSKRAATYVGIKGHKDVYEVEKDFAPLMGLSARDLRDNTVLDLPLENIARIAVTRGMGNYELARKDGQWQVVSPVVARADNGKVAGVLAQVAHVQARQFVADAPSNYAQYGLATPAMLVKVTMAAKGAAASQPAATSAASGPAEESYTLAVGNKSTDNAYARLMNSPSVFQIDASILEQVPGDAAALRDKALLSVQPQAVSGVIVEQNGLKAQLAKRQNKWSMSGLASGPANEQAIGRLLECLGKLQADSFIDDPQSAAARSFDSPRGRITLLMSEEPGNKPTLRDTAGAALSALTGQLPNKAVTVLVGGTSGSGERTFLKVGDSPAIAAVKTADIAPLLTSPEGYWHSNIFSLPGNERIVEMQITRDGTTYVLNRDAKGNWRLAEPVDAPVQPNDANAIRELLENVQADGIVELGPQGPAKYAQASPIEVRLKAAVLTLRAQGTMPATATSKPAQAQYVLHFAKAADHTYVWLEGGPQTAVGEMAPGVYETLARELRPTDVLKVSAPNVKRVKIATAAATLDLQKQKDAWSDVADPLVKIDAAKVAGFIKDLQGVTAIRFVGRSASGPSAVETPAVTVEWTDTASHSLRIGATGVSATDRYAQLDGGELFLLSEESVKKMIRTLKDFEVGVEDKSGPAMPPGPQGMEMPAMMGQP